jgi:aryl-alcohol dehydrogenase-like predicted oxidoreductase
MNSRLALGSAQFGLAYGIASQVGRVGRDKVTQIVGHARAAGMNTLDTAISYGGSEDVLGEVGVGSWQVISKLPGIPQDCEDIDAWVNESVDSSLKRLKISKLKGLLLHRPEQLLGSQGDALYRALVSLRMKGRIKKIGVSVYDPCELDAIWPRYHFDIVQAPLNILDRRLIQSGWLERLREAGAEVHARSVFLQGLLLMGTVGRPKKFNRWHSLWQKWHLWLAEETLTPLQACLAFVLAQPEIERIVVGVDSPEQLLEIIAVYERYEKNVLKFPNDLVSYDTSLINPTEWKSL